MNSVEKLKKQLEIKKAVLEEESLSDEEIKDLKLKQDKFFYDLIVDVLEDYENNYYSEVVLSGDRNHRLKQLTENRLIELIEESEDAIKLDKDSFLIINKVCRLKLNNVALRILDIDGVGTMQDKENKENMGMIACIYNLEDVAMKSLDNYEASIQQDEDGRNIGMYAAEYKMENVVIKALDNKEASTQLCNQGRNMGMYSAFSYMEEAVLKALDNHEASLQQDNYQANNIGLLCAKRGLKKGVIKALGNKSASLQQNNYGENIGIVAAYKLMKIPTLIAMQNDELMKQWNVDGSKITSTPMFRYLENEMRIYNKSIQDLIIKYAEEEDIDLTSFGYEIVKDDEMTA